MNLINLKKYANEYFNFIYNDDKRFIYTTTREIQNEVYFCICNYYIKEEKESVVKSFKIKNKNYYDFRVFYKAGNIFILHKEKNILNVSRLTSFKNIIKEEDYNIYLEGEIRHIDILNERYFIVFIEKKDILGNKYKPYKSSKRYSYKFAYLVDLEESDSYFIFDTKFAIGARDYIKLTYINSLECIFFEEAYREAWEKEFYYFKGIFDVESDIKSSNSINYMDFDKFVKMVKQRKKNLDFEIIDSIGKEGTVRYLGEDSKKLYYRRLDFKTNMEEIFSFEKHTEFIKKEEDINHNKKIGEFYYDSDKITVFFEEDLDDYNRIIGIFNRRCDIIYNKNIGMVEDFVDDRYLITYYSEECEGESYNYAVIKDTHLNKELQYEGNIRSLGNCIVLY